MIFPSPRGKSFFSVFLALFLSTLLFLGFASSSVFAQGQRNCTVPQSDINRDGTVDVRDYAILVVNFFKRNFDNRTDLNNDGKVNVLDFHILQLNLGRNCASPSPTV